MAHSHTKSKHHHKHHKKTKLVENLSSEEEKKAQVLAAEAKEDSISDIIGSKTEELRSADKYDSSIAEFDKLQRGVYVEDKNGRVQLRHASDNYVVGQNEM